MEFELVKYPHDWDRIAPDWLQLFQHCPRPCVFYHPLFLEAAVGFFEEPPTHFILGYQDQKLSFGLPVHLKKRWGIINQINIFQGVGFDHLAPLDITPGFTATQSFFESMGDLHDFLIFQGGSLDSGFIKLLATISRSPRYHLVTRRVFGCPYLSLPSSQEELLAILDKNFQPNLSRSLRKAQKANIEFRFLTSSGPTYNFLDAFHNLGTLHAERFQSLGRPSKFLAATPQQYYGRICEKADHFQDIIWFTEAMHQDQVIGSLFGFLTKARFHYYQMGFSSQYDKYSLGTLLLYQTMVALIQREIYLFDFLRGMDPYKSKWTRTAEEDYWGILGISGLGRLALEWLRLERSRKRHGRLMGILYRIANRD